jgi:hypothetical protein
MSTVEQEKLFCRLTMSSSYFELQVEERFHLVALSLVLRHCNLYIIHTFRYIYIVTGLYF